MVRSRFVVICGCAVVFGLASSVAQPPADTDKKAGPKTVLPDKPVKLDAGLLQKGLSLLTTRMPDVHLSLAWDFRPRFEFKPQIGLVNINSLVTINTNQQSEKDKEHHKRLEQIAQEHNDLLRQLVDVERERLRIEKEQFDRRIAFDTRMFKHSTEGVLRKETYAIPPDALAVVVADFSSGGPEGVEIANEIAYQLGELAKPDRGGLKIHVLSGEVRYGAIRGAEAAHDVGRHFPPGTSYVVVWGSLSPRTAGLFHPYITCCLKTKPDEGTRETFELNLDPESLPPADQPEQLRIEAYRRLIGITTASIPVCYAAYRINREEVPDLDQFYRFAGEASEPVKTIRQKLSEVTEWSAVRARDSKKLGYLRRLTQISAEEPLPAMVLNTRDGSVMSLVRDQKGRPETFADGGRNYMTYIDVTETTNRQFIDFWNDSKKARPADWLKLDPTTVVNLNRDPGTGRIAALSEPDERRPVFNVTHKAATEYCKWAGKDLPKRHEWQAAARCADPNGGIYPWGPSPGQLDVQCNCQGSKDRPGQLVVCPVGSFPKDKSAIGCLDMAGNVAEWCLEYGDIAETRRVFCGGSYNDGLSEKFDMTRHRNESPDQPQPWIGFRGVVRVYLDKK